MRKYVICPGTIRSKNDGELHYIGSYKLCKLYNVKPEECYFLDKTADSFNLKYNLSDEEEQKLIYLWPNYNGDYTIPNESNITK